GDVQQARTTGLLAAHLVAGRQGGGPQPRLAAERRRFDERRNYATAGVRNIGIETPATRGKCFDKCGPIPAHGAVRLDCEEENVGTLDEAEVGARGWGGGERTPSPRTALIRETARLRRLA